MNQSNFEYLSDQIKYTGFGEGMEQALKDNLQKQNPDFQLTHQAKFNDTPVTAVLQFSKSKQSDMYFFNRYQLSIEHQKDNTSMEQTFYINKGNHNITLKEAFNLMEGRAVNKDLTNKDGDIYNAWIQFDFKEAQKNGNYKMEHYTQNYGYSLEDALGKHPIKELGDEKDKNALIESLEKGNRQAVTFKTEGGEQRHFVEANPRFKTVNIYDSSMHRQSTREAKTEGQAEQQSTAQDKKQVQGKSAKDDGDAPTAANKRSNKKGKSIH